MSHLIFNTFLALITILLGFILHICYLYLLRKPKREYMVQFALCCKRTLDLCCNRTMSQCCNFSNHLKAVYELM